MPKILYVDDDPQMLQTFEVCYGDRFKILTCASPEQALELVGREKIGVILVDLEMPGMNGLELAKRVREEKPHIVRIVTTGGDLGGALEGVTQGVVRDCIAKPWQQDVLGQSLADGLECHLLHVRAHELESRLYRNERLYALGLATAGIVHEIRNPLTALTGNVDVRSLELGDLEKALEQGNMAAATKLVRGLRGYVDEDLESIEFLAAICRGVEQSGPSSDRREYSNLVEIVRTTLQGLQGNMRGRSRLHLTLDETTPRVRGSRTKLAQVFLNLFTNAMQACKDEDGGVEITVEVKSSEDKVHLVVADNGVGIPPEILPEIFQPFFTTKNEHGTGLGLAITRKLVDEMHGVISVESAADSGTRFVISLPAA